MGFRFTDYSKAELKKCGSELKQRLCQMDTNARTPEWTYQIMEFFSHSAALNTRPFGHPRTNERQLDQYHEQHDPTNPELPGKYYLALESEWGVLGNVGRGRKLIMDDAEKIARISAKVKVMIFGSNNAEDRKWIVEALASLRDRLEDHAPWLWFDVSWAFSGQPDDIDLGVLTEGQRS